MSNPLVSVIMPVYNGEQFLRLALDSVFAQNYRPLDIIVVDDGSTDHSADIACSFKGVRYFYQENQGDGLARNHGIAQAQGDFISFLVADDLWAPHKTYVQIEYLKKKADRPHREKLQYLRGRVSSQCFLLPQVRGFSVRNNECCHPIHWRAWRYHRSIHHRSQ